MSTRPKNPAKTPDPTDEMVQAITRKMRETYQEIGKSLIPLLENTPEDIKTLRELGEVYETLDCIEEAVSTYARALELDPQCLPESARAFLDKHLPPST